MKKKLLSFIFAICLIVPAMFCLSACDITEDDDVQVRVQDGYVQWCTATSEWQNIITIDEILDSIGDDLKGEQGNPGVNGKQVIFRKTETHIQWSYEGSENWTDLVALIEIKGDTGTGEKGNDGNGIKSITIDSNKSDATKTTYVITFDDDATYSYEVKNGTNGANGSVVTIGGNGNWFIDGVDSGVLARGTDGNNGANGKDGNGIKSITIDTTKTDEAKTTYVITFDDDTTYPYEVKNGTNGTNGTNGKDGSVVTIGEDGYWYIDGEKTEVKAKGEDAVIDTYTITYDYGIANTFFDNAKENEKIKATQWLTNMPEIKSEYKNSFLGWFIKDTNKQIENYDFIGGDVTLEARFDKEELGLSGLYKNGKYVKTWVDIVEEYPDAVVNGEIVSYDIMSGNVGMPHSYFENIEGDLVVDNSVIKIGESAFARCLYLTSITLSNSIESIGRYAFEGTNICNEYQGGYYIGNSTNPYFALVKWSSLDLTIHSNCKVIGEYLFKGSQITQITIPGSIKILPNNIFESCLHLTDVIVQNGVVKIEDYAFYDCEFMVNISIPNSIEEIGKYAFGLCRKLNTNKYKEAQYIGNSENPYLVYLGILYNAETCNVHNDCKIMSTTSLTYSVPSYTKLILKKNIQQIGYEAIASSKLVEIYYEGDVNNWNNICLNERNKVSNATIYYYSATQPTQVGNYWHYDTDNVTPIVWSVN